jgi:hypothetical protein
VKDVTLVRCGVFYIILVLVIFLVRKEYENQQVTKLSKAKPWQLISEKKIQTPATKRDGQDIKVSH